MISALAIAALITAAASGAEPIPLQQQNALVQKYCAVCHSDAARNGGLSLQHFDAAEAPPSLSAMMLSKLKSGAIGAAGIPKPDKATSDAWVEAVAAASRSAGDWAVQRTGNATTASVVREASRNGGQPEVYRLILSCSPATREGSVQLSWSPEPKMGTLAASADSGAAVWYRVEGSEAMGNGSGVVLSSPAHVMLAEPGADWTMPAGSLTVGDLFPGEKVTFSFAGLPKEPFEPCFLRSR